MTRLAGNTLALMMAQAGTRLASLVVVLLIGRTLGPEGLGLYAIAGAVASLALVVADAGIDTVTIRTMARGQAVAPYLGALLPARLGLGLAAIAIGWLGAWAAGYEPAAVLLAVALTAAAALEIVATSLRAALRAAETMMSEAGLVLIGQVGRAAGIGLALAFGLGVPGMAGGAVVAALVSLAVAAAFVGRRFGAPRPRLDWSLWRDTARETGPVLAWLLLIQVGSRTDALFIGYWWPASEAGRFHAASGVLAGLNIAVAMTLAALYPALVRARAAGRRDHVARLTLPVLGGGLALTLTVSILAPLAIEPLLLLLLGDRFVGAGPALMILRWALPALVLTGVSGVVLRSAGRDRPLVWLALAGAVVSVALNALLIPTQGAIGAAVSTLMAEMAMAGTGVALLRGQGLAVARPVAIGLVVGGLAGELGLLAARLVDGAWWLTAGAGVAVAGTTLLAVFLALLFAHREDAFALTRNWRRLPARRLE